VALPVENGKQMFNRKRQTEASVRAMERRQREDEAPRLSKMILGLKELRLDIEERAGGASAARHIRRIVVDRAPALFVIPCSESRCRDGGHDLTNEIMRALGSQSTEFRGEDTCFGQVGSGSDSCGRVLNYAAHAQYD
jgi:hypothetical protein